MIADVVAFCAFIGNRMRPVIGNHRAKAIAGIARQAAVITFGMAMGPISVGDLAGLDVGYKARQALPETDSTE